MSSRVDDATNYTRATRELAGAMRSGAVITDRDVLASYARDESEAVGVAPEGLVRVASATEAAAVMRAASKHGVPVTARGAGTGRTGGATPTRGGWVMVFEQMASIREIDERDGIAVVEPGVVLGALHEAVEAKGLFYPPDPNSLSSCTLGGNIAENAAGPRAFKYGVTSDYVLGLEVVLADGTTLELGRRTAKGVTGYDLTSLVVGSEGTLAIVTRATLRLVRRPEALRTMTVFLDGEARVAPAIEAALRSRVRPRCVELLGAITLDLLRAAGTTPVPAGAKAMLLIELDGDAQRVERELETVGNAMMEVGALEVLVAKHSGDRERLWGVRRELSRTLRTLSTHKLSEDVVVPRSRLGALLEACRGISERHELRMPAYGHAGDGNLHVNFLWDTPDERPRVGRAIGELFEETIRLGGTLSGEHGIGALKAPYLPLEHSPELIALQRRTKETWDPQGILNPGKIFPPPGTHREC